MRGRIVPSRRQLHAELHQARSEKEAATRSVVSLAEMLKACLTREEAKAYMQYAVMLALAKRAGADMVPIIDAALEDGRATPIVLDMVLEAAVDLGVPWYRMPDRAGPG